MKTSVSGRVAAEPVYRIAAYNSLSGEILAVGEPESFDSANERLSALGNIEIVLLPPGHEFNPVPT